jgi:hypothetical protein
MIPNLTARNSKKGTKPLLANRRTPRSSGLGKTRSFIAGRKRGHRTFSLQTSPPCR